MRRRGGGEKKGLRGEVSNMRWGGEIFLSKSLASEDAIYRSGELSATTGETLGVEGKRNTRQAQGDGRKGKARSNIVVRRG